MKTNEKDTKRGVVPPLRFPEFSDAGNWVYLEGNKVFEQISNKKHSSNLPVLAISQEHGAVPRDLIDYKVIVSEESLENYKVVEIGDFIISLRSFQGGIEYSEYKGICSPAYIILRKRLDIDNRFFKYYFKSHAFIRDLNKNLEGIRDGKMVSYKQFSEILLPIPSIHNKKEQQKIADCLSSIDALIKATEKKIDELKAHKKGLMQQLFPADGKTVPALRFQEFQNSKEWSVRKLNELASRIIKKNRQGYIRKVLTNSAAEGVVDQAEYFDRNIVNQDNLQNYYIIENGDYVYNPRISTLAPVGPISKNLIGQGVMSPLYIIFRFMDNKNEFYNQYFKTTYWHKYLKDIANQGARFDRMSITADDFMNMPLPAPSQAEQQKIADCLSSVDDLITAQTNRLEALKAHKKGLMQQLFPNTDEC